MQVPNSQLKPNADGSFPDRKMTPMYNYAAGQWQFAIAKKTERGVTIYLDADGSTFTSLDTDPTRHSSEMGLTAGDIKTLLSIAQEVPAEALAMFSELPEELKPQLRESLKTLPTEARAALKTAAQAIAP